MRVAQVAALVAGRARERFWLLRGGLAMPRAEYERRQQQPWDQDQHAQQLVAEHPGGMSQDAVAEYLGLTRQRVAQIEQAALQKLCKVVDS